MIPPCPPAVILQAQYESELRAEVARLTRLVADLAADRDAEAARARRLEQIDTPGRRPR